MNSVWTPAVVLSTPILVGALLGCGRYDSPAQAYEDFQSPQGRAEDQLADPLILAGSDVVPIVLREVKRKDMRLRVYAIWFLGNGGYREAIPVLRGIIEDSSEDPSVRAAALGALWQIDETEARPYVAREQESLSALGERARLLEQGWHPTRRSYFDAVRGTHD